MFSQILKYNFSIIKKGKIPDPLLIPAIMFRPSRTAVMDQDECGGCTDGWFSSNFYLPNSNGNIRAFTLPEYHGILKLIIFIFEDMP